MRGGRGGGGVKNIEKEVVWNSPLKIVQISSNQLKSVQKQEIWAICDLTWKPFFGNFKNRGVVIYAKGWEHFRKNRNNPLPTIKYRRVILVIIIIQSSRDMIHSSILFNVQTKQNMNKTKINLKF